MSKKDKMRFSKKIIIFTMTCTVIYAIAYMVLCYRIGQLPDYSFNAGIFAALTAENGFNAWIKTAEAGQDNSTDNSADPVPVDDSNDNDDLLESDVPIQEEP
jgi:hypothetical protein